MSDVAIKVSNLGKQYRIGEAQERHDRFTEAVMHTLKAPVRRLRRLGQPAPPDETIWALRDVSFTVQKGEVIGIIGRNGAGKSTLLKILSRITDPTEGRVELHGRVGSLLEVGTGFHQELTGRENVYLNGAILGMTRAEIERKFDEIVDFAEIEKFIDTPVKRYSSGMYVRLAFAVAAHLEPEILLVDEVLAVGDVAFQKKCLGKMGDVASEGRTVLFVSHNMNMIQRLCPHTVLISEGQLERFGPTEQVVESYLRSKPNNESGTSLTDRPRKYGYGDIIRFNQCRVLNAEGSQTDQLLFGEPFTVAVSAETKSQLDNLSLVIGLDTRAEQRIATTKSSECNVTYAATPERPLQAAATFNELRLTPGHYSIVLGIRGQAGTYDHLLNVREFEVLQAAYDSEAPYSGLWGIIHTTVEWDS